MEYLGLPAKNCFFCSGYLRLAMFVAVKVGRAGKIIELLLLEELPEG